MTVSQLEACRRIRNDPHVRVGPCDMRGKPRGPLTLVTAWTLPPQEAAAACAALAASWTKPMGGSGPGGLDERRLGAMPGEQPDE